MGILEGMGKWEIDIVWKNEEGDIRNEWRNRKETGEVEDERLKKGYGY